MADLESRGRHVYSCRPRLDSYTDSCLYTESQQLKAKYANFFFAQFFPFILLKGESGWNFELNCELGQIFFLLVIRQENYSTLKY